MDLELLTELTDGPTDGLRELVALHFEQTARQISLIETAVRENQPAVVGREAHSCASASGTMGMTRLGKLLKELEALGNAGSLTTAAERCTEARAELKRVRDFLDRHLV